MPGTANLAIPYLDQSIDNGWGVFLNGDFDDIDSEWTLVTPSTQNYSDAPTAGVSTRVARADHKHAFPASPDFVDCQKNILVNGGFEIWQRGTQFFDGGARINSDQWFLNTGIANGGVSQINLEGTIVDRGSRSLKFTTSGSAAGASTGRFIYQDIENWKDFVGKQVYFTARIKSPVANVLRIGIDDGTATAQSSYHTGDNTFQTLKVTLTVSASATRVRFQIGFLTLADIQAGLSHDYYFDCAMAVQGAAPSNFVPLSVEEDIARCQRYYELLGGWEVTITAGLQPLYLGSDDGTNYKMAYTYRYNVTKAAVPTLSFYGGGLEGWSEEGGGFGVGAPYTVSLTGDADGCTVMISKPKAGNRPIAMQLPGIYVIV